MSVILIYLFTPSYAFAGALSPYEKSEQQSCNDIFSHSPLNSGNLKAGTLKILALGGPYISIVYRLNYYRVMTEKSIKEVSDLWKRDKKQYVKQSTYAAYILILENHILPAFEGNTTISEDDVQAFVINKLESGMRQKTVRDIVIVLKMVVRYGAKLGLDWKSDWQLHYPTSQGKDAIEVLSIENHRKIMNYIQGNFTFKNLGVYVCLSSGLRIGEICALKWEDIDVRESVIHVRRTLERVYVMDEEPRRTVLIEGVPKTVVNGNQKCSDFGNSECSIFGIKTTVLLASAVQ